PISKNPASHRALQSHAQTQHHTRLSLTVLPDCSAPSSASTTATAARPHGRADRAASSTAIALSPHCPITCTYTLECGAGPLMRILCHSVLWHAPSRHPCALYDLRSFD